MRPVTVVLAIVVAAACARPQPELRIDGSPGVAPLFAAVAEGYRAANPRHPVTFGNGLGTSARIAALADGKIDVAMASHGVDTADLRRRGLVAHEVARTAVVFAVSGNVMRTGITPAIVCDIYSGRLGSWADQLGIVPMMRPAAEVDAEVALAAIPCLRQVTMARSVMMIERPDDMAAEIASRAGAIGLTSMPYVERSDHRLRALAFDGVEPTPENVASGRYPMWRRAILLTRADPPSHVRRFLEYVRSAEGARLLREAGAVPAQ